MANSRSNSKDILKELAKDHRELKALFKRMDMTSDRGTKNREKIFGDLKSLLTAHAKAEEATIYDRLKEEQESRDMAIEAEEEHHVAKFTLRELDMLPKNSENWTAKMNVLREMVEMHIQEEEKELFKLARRVLEPEELREIGERFLAEKQDIMDGTLLPVRLTKRAMRKVGVG